MPTRLALQTGELDDHRPPITPQHPLWQRAHALFCEQADLDDRGYAVMHDDDMPALCASWPKGEAQPDDHEALAVALALAAPFGGDDRVLAALAVRDAAPATIERWLADAALLASAPGTSRRRLPLIYDPDVEARAPIVAMVDGPRSPAVAALLATIKERDRNLADAMVLGADLEMLDLLERLCLDAERAGRRNLAEMFEHDRMLWRERADTARARQRLEGAHYGWCIDNAPPGCLEAARAEIQHDVENLLHPPAASG